MTKGLFKILILLFVFSNGRISYAQVLTSNSLKLSISGGLQTGNVLSNIDHGIIYFMPGNTDKSEREIYMADLDGQSKGVLTISSNKLKGLENERIIQFVVSTNNLILLTNKSIHFFERRKDSFYVVKTIKNKYSFDRIEKLGNSFLLQVCYSFHPLDQAETNLWAKVDFMSKEIYDLHVPEIDNSKFGSFVNSWVSCYEGTIVHASTSQYKVMLYDENFVPFDSIVNSEENFQLDTNLINRADLHSKNGISNFMKVDDERLTRIRKVMMLDAGRILILSKFSQEVTTNKGKVRLDLWDKSSGIWKLTSQIFGDEIYREGEPYNLQNIFLGDLYQNVFDIESYSGDLYCISFPFYPNVNTTSFKRETDIDVYFKESTEFNYGLEKFSFGNH